MSRRGLLNHLVQASRFTDENIEVGRREVTYPRSHSSLATGGCYVPQERFMHDPSRVQKKSDDFLPKLHSGEAKELSRLGSQYLFPVK